MRRLVPLVAALLLSACSRKEPREPPAPPNAGTPGTEAEADDPLPRPRTAAHPVRGLRPPEEGPAPRPLSEPIRVQPAPAACLRVPEGPPFAALFRRLSEDSREAFVLFRSGDGVAITHRDQGIDIARRVDPSTVETWTVSRERLDAPLADPEVEATPWWFARTPFPVRRIDVRTEVSEPVTRRCAQVRVYEGQAGGRPVRLHHLERLDLPEWMELGASAEWEQLVLMGFLNPEPYAELAARLPPAERDPASFHPPR